MAEVRKQGINERKRLYGLDRIEDQLKWYRSKVHSNSRLAKRWLIALIGFQFMAITFALARLGFPTGPNWPVGVFSAAAVAAMAWIQAKQFRERAASYSLSFHEASLVRGRLENLASEQELSAFVLDVERILSRERHRTLG